ncbi:uncharacterized protein LOC128875602 [Hylaeus volcanicus]|uniref:uncharacterized protein LOC128875602 n=1 Tax=Hylaeus volcanicus TaxID=313075 RepID=UPI0023B7F832|nr:uncharacterized protein LOC128875602 [Hylaeus volcanicus]
MKTNIFGDSTTQKMANDKSNEDYSIHSTELDKQCFSPWSPLQENDALLKHRYISCSRSVPHRNRRFVRYKINRSLNFDANAQSSSSENSSFEEDKHLSRSAKIMRALNCTTSPSYYGRTKIKKSLNFNLTPSPKRFLPARSIRKTLSLNFGSPLSASSKLLNFEDDSNDSVKSKLIFTSTESIDENQNETPSQHSTKDHDTLHFSTPNTTLSRKSLYSTSFTPVLRSRLKETIDNIVYITATPNSQSLKSMKGRTKGLNNGFANTSRNLLQEFHDSDDDRPCTPENVIRIIPESMSAIKRSHRKERSSRWNGHSTTQATSSFLNNTNTFENMTKSQHKYHLQDSNSTDRSSSRNSDAQDIPSYSSEDDMSDTGSLFDYKDELKNVLDESKEVSNCMSNSDIVQPKFEKCDIKVKAEDNLPVQNIKTEARPVTPDLAAEHILEPQKSVTPENRIDFLKKISKDSIKKSHKKKKDVNKKKIFSSKVLQFKVGDANQADGEYWDNSEQAGNNEENKLNVEQNNFDKVDVERACTPEMVHSSRLLLPQFSSVKKSHKKDKHSKILSGFLKRQEYFNKEINAVKDNNNKAFNGDDASEYKKCIDLSSDFDTTANSSDSSYLVNVSAKLSPSKRKISLNTTSSSHDASVSCDSELQECDISQEEFQIFTPLKRKRPLIASNAKEYLHFYDLPSGKDEVLEKPVANINFSRCLTPVLSLQENYIKPEENHPVTIKSDDVSTEDLEVNVCESNSKTGRSTPRNMSTEELYSNIDSIKKSHKKNKRGNISRKGFNLIRSNLCDEKGQSSSEDIKNETFEKLESPTDSIDHEKVEGSSGSANDHDSSSANPIIAIQNVTPPNCLKAKNYMKLLQETSIKRSHKKVRDQRKREARIDTNELSDDGSIFGDEEKLNYVGEEHTTLGK